jgi:hypothetical protein
VVGSADQIPPDGDINFCRIIAETIETYGTPVHPHSAIAGLVASQEYP